MDEEMSSAVVAVAVDEVGPILGEADALNNLERLILAQAVYELGSNAWTSVSSILSQHPLISKRDDASFSPLVSLSLPLSFHNSAFYVLYRPAKIFTITF